VTILAIVCEPPNTLLFADRRVESYDPSGVVVNRTEEVEIHNLDTGEVNRRPFVKVVAHRKGLIWATAGTANLSYQGRDRMAHDVIGAFFDQMQGGSFDMGKLIEFLAPLVTERGKVHPGVLHVLLGTAFEAFYLWFPTRPAESPTCQQIQRKIIPSYDTEAFFGGWVPTGDEFFPPRDSAPNAIVGYMRPLLERAIAFAQQAKGAAGADVAGPIDVAICDPAGARILTA